MWVWGGQRPAAALAARARAAAAARFNNAGADSTLPPPRAGEGTPGWWNWLCGALAGVVVGAAITRASRAAESQFEQLPGEQQQDRQWQQLQQRMKAAAQAGKFVVETAAAGMTLARECRGAGLFT